MKKIIIILHFLILIHMNLTSSFHPHLHQHRRHHRQTIPSILATDDSNEQLSKSYKSSEYISNYNYGRNNLGDEKYNVNLRVDSYDYNNSDGNEENDSTISINNDLSTSYNNNNNNNNNNNIDSNNNDSNNNYNNKHKNKSNSDTLNSTSSLPPVCPTCQNSGVKMSESELTELRITFVKNQILKKLRLTERPLVTLTGLPRPITEGDTIHVHEHDMDSLNRRLDDYYAKTTQKIIFLKEEMEQCENLIDVGSCFSFQIPEDVDVGDVNSAQLWVYKKPDNMDQHRQTFIVSEVAHWDTKRSFPKSNTIAIQETSVKSGWLKIDVAWPVKNWFQYHELTHVIQISCKTCGTNSSHGPIYVHNDRKPFIVVDTHSQRKHRRQRRNVNCAAGVTECCREKYYISFADIGWNDWILHPPGYHAYFCRGTCSSAATVTLSGSHYNSVIRKVLYQRTKDGNNKNLELIPCCTATRFSSLQLFYMDSNNTATQKTLPNMVVEACGCM